MDKKIHKPKELRNPDSSRHEERIGTGHTLRKFNKPIVKLAQCE